jgi:predicted esterase
MALWLAPGKNSSQTLVIYSKERVKIYPRNLLQRSNLSKIFQMPNKSYPALYIALIAILTLAACYSPAMQARPEIADRLAHPMRMVKRFVSADPFELTAYERVSKKGRTANIYIEGDGQTWISWSKESQDPTPTNPVSLHLASKDLSENVIYLARPCQFNPLPKSLCFDPQHWTDGRYNKLTIESMHKALNDIKRRYNITGFNLVGFGGGGSVAIILGARRNDVKSIRTIAAIFDHEAVTSKLDTRAFHNSLNPIDFAAQIAHIPQHHFIGKYDEIASSSHFYEFQKEMGKSSCLRYSIIDETAHELGWVNRWETLLKFPLDCRADL